MADNNCYLKEYYEECKSGNIVVGQELMTELDRLIDDLESGIYRYETDEAHLRIDFMENLCLQSKNPFYMKPLKLMLWQKAFFEVVYSFKVYSEENGKWIRRFKKVLLLIARKNGKTTMMAGDAHFDLRCGDGGMDIVCASNDDKQADLLWSEIEGMRKRLDPKMRFTHKNLKNISNKKNDTKIFKMSAKTQNKDGRNIDKTYMDESHDAKDDEIAGACEKSMSTKIEPLFFNLTTEGVIDKGYLDQELAYARGVLREEIEDDSYLPWLYTQDSEEEVWQDERSWQKANPSLGVVKKASFIRGELEKSKIQKSTRMQTLCKDFNIKQNAAQSWLMREDYVYEQPIFDLEEFRGQICIGAVDLSATTDLSNAKILLMRPGDDTRYVYSHYWIPETKLRKSPDESSGAKYSEWAKDGILTIHEGNEIDISQIADWFFEIYDKYDIRLLMCGYDQRYAKTFLDRMNYYGFATEMIYQNKYVMSSPMKLVEAELKSRSINYNQNDMDRWCLGNASIQIDSLGNIMCVKISNNEKRRIDGAVTLIILYEVFRRHRDEMMSILQAEQ